MNSALRYTGLITLLGITSVPKNQSARAFNLNQVDAICLVKLSAVDRRFDEEKELNLRLNKEGRNTYRSKIWTAIPNNKDLYLDVAFFQAENKMLPHFNVLSRLWEKNRSYLISSGWDGGYLEAAPIDDANYFAKIPQTQKTAPYSKRTLIYDPWAFNETLALGFKSPEAACREGGRQDICQHINYLLINCHTKK